MRCCAGTVEAHAGLHQACRSIPGRLRNVGLMPTCHLILDDTP